MAVDANNVAYIIRKKHFTSGVVNRTVGDIAQFFSQDYIIVGTKTTLLQLITFFRQYPGIIYTNQSVTSNLIEVQIAIVSTSIVDVENPKKSSYDSGRFIGIVTLKDLAKHLLGLIFIIVLPNLMMF